MNITGINYGFIYRNLSTNNNLISIVNERLSSGKRVNRASDAPSDILRINRLYSKIRGTEVASRNIQDSISLLQTGESALSQVQDIGQRLKELSVQFNNDTISNEDKEVIKNEATGILKEIKNITDNTEFNNIKIFSKGSFVIQSGSEANDVYKLSVKGLDVSRFLDTAPSSTTPPPSTTPSPPINTEPAPTIPDGYIEWTDSSGHLRYIGDVKNSKPDGYGNFYDEQGNLLYMGDFINGHFSGYGNLSKPTGELYYAGDFLNGLSNGYGHEYDSKGKEVYSGEFKDGKYNGYGIQNLFNGYSYQGDFSDGMKNGYGNLYDSNGSLLYSGNWTDNNPSDGTSISGYTASPPGVIVTPTIPTFVNDTSTMSLYSTETSNTGTINTIDTTSSVGTASAIGSTEISTLLSDDNVDKYILNPVSDYITHIGTQEEILNLRFDMSQNQIPNMEDSLSKIEDTDMAKELLNLSKAKILSQTNTSLLAQMLDYNKDYITTLLS